MQYADDITKTTASEICLKETKDIRWPRKIRSEQIYNITKQIPWSKIIPKKRLSWFGRLARLPNETLAKKALLHAIKTVKLPKGKQKNMDYNE